ncbi:MAG: glycosyltransferase family 2 protein [bacterium]|nr:glycosyltransferase family 2 protein [bacterium]
MVNKPLVTIGITVFNGASYISRAIETAIDQTYQQLEILILDDASQDDTEAIIKRLSLKDLRVNYVRNNENIGYARSLQKLAELAKGEYMQLLGADDWLSKNYIRAALDEFDAHPNTACVAPEMVLLKDIGDNRFDFIHSFLPKKRLVTTSDYIKNIYKTASVLPTLTAYALFRKNDFLQSINFMNNAFASSDIEIPIELRELHLKGFATETIFLLRIIYKYDYFIITDKVAYVKIEYTSQDKKPYNSKGLDWVSADGILRWFYFTRIAYEYLFKTDYKKYYKKFHIYFLSELFVTSAIVFIKIKQKRYFFNDLKGSEFKKYIKGYSMFEFVIAFLYMPVLFLRRLFSFIDRISESNGRKNTMSRSDLFLDNDGFFNVG